MTEEKELSNKYAYDISPFMEELHSDEGWPKFRRIRDALAAEAAVDLLEQLTREFIKSEWHSNFAVWLLGVGQPKERPFPGTDNRYYYVSFFYKFDWGEQWHEALQQSVPGVDMDELLVDELSKVLRSHGLSAHSNALSTSAIYITPR